MSRPGLEPGPLDADSIKKTSLCVVLSSCLIQWMAHLHDSVISLQLPDFTFYYLSFESPVGFK